jgi:hypothetical protein
MIEWVPEGSEPDFNVGVDCNAAIDPSSLITSSNDPDGDPLTVTVDPSTPLGLGTHIVTVTVSDGVNPAVSKEFIVDVVDQNAPVLSTVPGPITVECDEVPVPADVTVTDACDANVVVVFDEVRADGNCPGNYTLTRTWTATDASGNVATGSQFITVQDITAPDLVGVPADATVECDSVPAPAAVSAADNCDDAPVVVFDEVRADGNCPSSYTLTRTWTATDVCGNTSSATQVVTVQDTTAPVLAGVPGDVTVECDSVPAPADVSATDNCSTFVITFDEVRTDGNCPSSYTLARTWTATDECGNASSATQVVTVQDTTAPDPIISDLTDVSPNQAPIAFSVTSGDNCGLLSVLITEVTRHKVNKKGKVTFIDVNGDEIKDEEESKSKGDDKSKSEGDDKSKSKSESEPDYVIEGGQVIFNETGGVDTIITIYATATDECGNTTDGIFTANVLKPAKSPSKSKKSAANEGLGNGVDGDTPGHDNNGGNDDEGNKPGDPGATKKNDKKNKKN